MFGLARVLAVVLLSCLSRFFWLLFQWLGFMERAELAMVHGQKTNPAHVRGR